MYFEDLATAVESLDVPGNCAAIAELLPLLGRLEAKLAAVVDEVNRSGEWELEGATSMTAWLRWAGRMSGGAAKAMTTSPARTAALPVTAAAWESGELSSGQVKVITGYVDERREALFAEHEAEVVPYLAPLTVRRPRWPWPAGGARPMRLSMTPNRLSPSARCRSRRCSTALHSPDRSPPTTAR